MILGLLLLLTGVKWAGCVIVVNLVLTWGRRKTVNKTVWILYNITFIIPTA
jgi:hypothetical protein